MRLISLFRKTMIENFRDWKILILILTLAPFFVVLMYFYFGNAKYTFQVIVINRDAGVERPDHNIFNAGQAVITELMKAKHPDGSNILMVRQEQGREAALNRLREKGVDLVVEIPENFSKILHEYSQDRQPSPALVKTFGNPANAKYIMAGAWSDAIAFQCATAITGVKGPLELQAETISPVKSLSDFELYVPALLALSLMCLMFTAAASLIKEKDKETIVRLRLSNMTTFEWLSAVSLTQIVIGLLALGATYLTAVAFGFKASGSLLALSIIGLLSALAIVAISLIVAAFLRTIFDLMTVGCFPFFILMFFSGGMFPLPDLRLLSIGGRPLNMNDFLPTTHTISALNKVLNYGAGLRDVVFEVGAIAALTAVYFAIGTWLFSRRHMRAK